MLDARELQTLARQARSAKEEKEKQQRVEKEAQESLKNENKAREQFEVFFPRLAEKIKEIAVQGWSSCGVEIPKDDVVELDPDLTNLRGFGKLLYDAYLESGLKLNIECELYDRPPEYGSAERVYYIEIIWDKPSEREKYKGPYVNTLRVNTPLIRWCHLIGKPRTSGTIQTDYPE